MKKAIAIDFDGCLCVNVYPKIGHPNWPVIVAAQEEQAAGAGLILWTCREGKLLDDALQACAGWGLHFDAVNESLPEWLAEWKNAPRKVGATEYWDDRAVVVCAGQTPQVNRPLTLNDLVEMDGEPVWVNTLAGPFMLVRVLNKADHEVRLIDRVGHNITLDEITEDGGKVYRCSPATTKHARWVWDPDGMDWV